MMLLKTFFLTIKADMPCERTKLTIRSEVALPSMNRKQEVHHLTTSDEIIATIIVISSGDNQGKDEVRSFHLDSKIQTTKL
jgi:hypothetical protein